MSLQIFISTDGVCTESGNPVYLPIEENVLGDPVVVCPALLSEAKKGSARGSSNLAALLRKIDNMFGDTSAEVYIRGAAREERPYSPTELHSEDVRMNPELHPGESINGQRWHDPAHDPHYTFAFITKRNE